MRLSSAKLSVLTMALALANGSITLAQDSSAANPSVSTKTPQVTQPSEGGVNWKGVGVGAGTMAGNVLYVPAKLVYGLLGGIGGGAAWALTGGNTQVADTVWRSSLGGDYILTPDMILGKQKVHFSGPTDTAPTAESSSNTAASNSSSSLASAGPSASSNYAGVNASSSLSSSSSSLSSTSVPASASASYSGTHPIDSGAGPVSNSVPSSSYKASSATSSASYGSSASSAASSPKLNTSIE